MDGREADGGGLREPARFLLEGSYRRRRLADDFDRFRRSHSPLTRSSSLAFCRCSSTKYRRYRRQAWHRASTIHDNVLWSGSASYSYARHLGYEWKKREVEIAFVAKLVLC